MCRGKVEVVDYPRYYFSNYKLPQIAPEACYEKTYLMDSKLSQIPLGEQTELTFSPAS
jgi:hypothetical protein